jgi:chemotaxis-related protein WspB
MVPTVLAVMWRAAGLLLATSADSIVEVLPPLSCRAAAAVPEWVRGLVSHRGRLIPVVDVARLLSGSAEPDRMTNRVIVVRAQSPAIEWHVGLWVERVLEIERIDFAATDVHPGFETERGRFLGPIAPTRFGNVQFLRPDELFTPEEAAVLAQRLAEDAA